MTKQEYIKLKWEEAGLIWDEIKFIVSPVTGGLQLQTPLLKTTLTGYSSAYNKGLLKGYDFDNNGFKVWNRLLDGFGHNNGWTKIESEADLPPYNSGGKYKCFTELGNEVELNGGNAVRNAYKEADVTHYKPIKQDLPPLY